MTDTTQLRAASLKARQDKALDRTRNLPGIGVTTFRDELDKGRFAYRLESRHADGTTTHGLIECADLEAMLVDNSIDRALRYASYHETPKLIADYAAHLPKVIIPTHSDLPLEFIKASKS